MRKDEKINYNLIMPSNFWAKPVYNFKKQSLFFIDRTKLTRWFVAFVLINKIEKGKDYDIIYGVVGASPNMEEYCKRFVCKNRNARHQIYTLHRGEWAILFGKALVSNFKIFYVEGIWATYVPKAYEIKSHLQEETSGEFDDLNETTNQETLDFIDELLNSTKGT